MSLLDTFMSVWGVRRVELKSPLSPSECIERLRDATEGFSFFPGASDRLFKGHVVGRRAWLMRRRVLQNSWAAMAACKVNDDGLMSSIQVKIGVALGVRIFMMYAFGFIALWLAGATFAVATQDEPYIWLMPVFGVVLTVMFVGMTILGRSIASGDEAFLEGSLRSLLQAQA